MPRIIRLSAAAIIGLIMGHMMAIPVQAQAPVASPPESARTANPMAVYFPEKAKKSKMSGVVVVSCAVRGNGGFEACQIVREMPLNYGFGAATLKMVSEIGQADLKRNKPGDVVQATIKWTYSPDK